MPSTPMRPSFSTSNMPDSTQDDWRANGLCEETQALLREWDKEEALNPEMEKRSESRMINLYATVICTTLLVLSGVIVLLSENMPDWLSKTLFSSPSSIVALKDTQPQIISGNQLAINAQTGLSSSKASLQITPTAFTRNAIAYPSLPRGFEAVWTTQKLDNNRISLLMLKNPFKVSETTNQSGAEYFAYNAYLLRQLTAQMREPKLKNGFKQLALLSENMAVDLKNGSRYEFNGIPDETLTHLQMQKSALQALQGITQNPLRVIDYDRNGKNISKELQNTKIAFLAGNDLLAYQRQLRNLMANPDLAKTYPQTKALIQEQSRWLENLARHLEVRWESVFSCHASQCDKGHIRVKSMRVYVRQTLNEQKALAPRLG